MPVLEGVIIGIISLVGYGLSDYFGAISSKKLGGFQTATISRAVSFIFLLVVFFAFFQMIQITITQIGLVILTGFLADVGVIFFCKGFQVGNISVVSSIGNASIAVTVILLLIFFSIPLNILQEVGITAIILGTILASFKLKDLKKLKFTKFISGSQYAIVSFFAWGLSVFLSVILVKQLGYILPTLLVYLVISLFNIAYSVLTKVKYSNTRLKSILPITIIAGITSAIGLLSFSYGVSLNYAIITAPISGAAPMLTVLLAFLVTKEKIELNQKIGIALILISIVALSLS